MSRTTLAAELRRLAKHLDANPDHLHPSDPGRKAGLEMVEHGLTVLVGADQALQRAQDYGGRGYAGGSTAEGRGKGGHTSPTESAALAPPSMAADFTAAGEQLRQSLTDGAGMARKAANQTKRLLDSAPPMTATEEARCKEASPGGCEDLAVKDRRCSRCYDFLRRHPEQQHVPAEEIAKRRTRDRLPVS